MTGRYPAMFRISPRAAQRIVWLLEHAAVGARTEHFASVTVGHSFDEVSRGARVPIVGFYERAHIGSEYLQTVSGVQFVANLHSSVIKDLEGAELDYADDRFILVRADSDQR